jgi:hypothetical protein
VVRKEKAGKELEMGMALQPELEARMETLNVGVVTLMVMVMVIERIVAMVMGVAAMVMLMELVLAGPVGIGAQPVMITVFTLSPANRYWRVSTIQPRSQRDGSGAETEHVKQEWQQQSRNTH